MIKHVVLSGCSLAYGLELSNLKDNYGKLVSDKLSAHLHNVSEPGNCNQLIVDYMIESVTSLIKTEDRDSILVVLSWSYPDRIPVYNKEHSQFTVLTKRTFSGSKNQSSIRRGGLPLNLDRFELKIIYDHYNDYYYFKYKFLREMLFAVNFLQNNNIKYVMTFPDEYVFQMMDIDSQYYNASDKFHKIENKTLLCNIDSSFLLPTSFIGLCDQNKYQKGPQGHPLEVCHSEYSKIILNFIGEKYGLV